MCTDKDGSGSIDIYELDIAMAFVGVPGSSASQILENFAKMDTGLFISTITMQIPEGAKSLVSFKVSSIKLLL